jgi:hypothetical protein
MENRARRLLLTTLLFTALTTTVGTASPVPPVIKSAVAFVYVHKDGQLVPSGTGFFVAARNPTDPNVVAVYLATARHVLCEVDASTLLPRVFLRLNTKARGCHVLPLSLVTDGPGKNVFTHPDPAVDLAVVPYLPNPQRYEFMCIPVDMITTRQAYQRLDIREGSDVFFAGLFLPYPGVRRNYPVVRFGRVALVTDEAIPWRGRSMHLYLIEARAYGGNSGSPVFFDLSSGGGAGGETSGQPVVKLAGVMMGTFLGANQVRILQTKPTPVALSSVGIAAVTPGYRLHEVLLGQELRAQRGW